MLQGVAFQITKQDALCSASKVDISEFGIGAQRPITFKIVLSIVQLLCLRRELFLHFEITATCAASRSSVAGEQSGGATSSYSDMALRPFERSF